MICSKNDIWFHSPVLTVGKQSNFTLTTAPYYPHTFFISYFSHVCITLPSSVVGIQPAIKLPVLLNFPSFLDILKCELSGEGKHKEPRLAFVSGNL